MSLHHIAPRDDYDPAWDNETYVRACPDCGTQGALHLNGCPPAAWWCICGRPLRPDETEPCDKCVAELEHERRKDWAS